MLVLSTLLVMSHYSWAHGQTISSYRGEAEFKKVTLQWTLEPSSQLQKSGSMFRIKFCENQIWGEHYCREQEVQGSRAQKSFSTKIHGLKMSTNYTFYLSGDLVDRHSRQLSAVEKSLFLVTKGFSAKAVNCGKDETEVLVETGPNFGGKISVEGAEGRPGCEVRGERSSLETAHSFMISHKDCGSQSNSSAVWTYVVVQENGSILTQSTRRFLVLCQYKMPGTFTVKAGFALPGQLSPDTGLADPGELEAVEPEYYEDFLPGLNNNNNYDNFNNNNNYDDFLTSLSHNSIDSSVLAAPEDHWASQRRSRTFSTNLFGSREVGGEARSLGDGGDKKMWMIVITVSSGLVVVSIMAVLVACRPRHKEDLERGDMGDMEMELEAEATEAVSDTEALQPRDSKLYRPSESRA